MKFRKEKRSNKSKFGWTRNNNIERTFPLEILVVTKYQSEIRDAMNYIINQYELCDIGYFNNFEKQIQTIDARYYFISVSNNEGYAIGRRVNQILYFGQHAFHQSCAKSVREAVLLPLIINKVPQEFQEIILEY